MGLFDVLFKRNELAREVQNLEARRNALLKDIADCERKANDNGAYIDLQQKKLNELQSAVGALNGIVEMQDMGMEYTPLDTNAEEI